MSTMDTFTQFGTSKKLSAFDYHNSRMTPLILTSSVPIGQQHARSLRAIEIYVRSEMWRLFGHLSLDAAERDLLRRKVEVTYARLREEEMGKYWRLAD